MRRTIMLTFDLPRLGLGCAPLANLYADIPERQAVDLIQFALANGVSFFDTAPLYGAGLSEERLGVALAGVPRDCFILATKVGRMVQPDGSMQFNWSRDGVRRSLDESLRRLRLDRVDILHLHDPDQHMAQALDEAYPALADLRAQGVIRAIGVGTNYWQVGEQIMRNADIDCCLLAGRYTLLEQTSLAFLAECKQRGVAVFLAGVYNSGILATGAVPGAKYNYADAPDDLMQRTRQIEAVCAAHDVALPSAALHFAAAHPAVKSLVVGAQSRQEFAQTIQRVQQAIPAAVWQALRERQLIEADSPLPVG
jgi:D-threo-aldose 1-dehydrogenase